MSTKSTLNLPLPVIGDQTHFIFVSMDFNNSFLNDSSTPTKSIPLTYPRLPSLIVMTYSILPSPIGKIESVTMTLLNPLKK